MTDLKGWRIIPNDDVRGAFCIIPLALRPCCAGREIFFIEEQNFCQLNCSFIFPVMAAAKKIAADGYAYALTRCYLRFGFWSALTDLVSHIPSRKEALLVELKSSISGTIDSEIQDYIISRSTCSFIFCDSNFCLDIMEETNEADASNAPLSYL